MKRFFGLNICMGVGLLDNGEETRNLPNANFDIKFGDGRLSRARNFYTFCKTLATRKNIPFNWADLLEISGIAHDNSTKYDSAGNVRKPGMANYFINLYRSSDDPLYQASKNQTSEFTLEDDDAR